MPLTTSKFALNSSIYDAIKNFSLRFGMFFIAFSSSRSCVNVFSVSRHADLIHPIITFEQVLSTSINSARRCSYAARLSMHEWDSSHCGSGDFFLVFAVCRRKEFFHLSFIDFCSVGTLGWWGTLKNINDNARKLSECLKNIQQCFFGIFQRKFSAFNWVVKKAKRPNPALQTSGLVWDFKPRK